MDIKNDLVLNGLPNTLKRKKETLLWAKNVDFRKTVEYCRKNKINHMIIGIRPNRKPDSQVVYIGKNDIDELPKRLIIKK